MVEVEGLAMLRFCAPRGKLWRPIFKQREA